MASSNDEFGTVSSFLNADLLQAIGEAGSRVPSGPASQLADKELGYKIKRGGDASSPPPSPTSPEGSPPAAPRLTGEPVELLISRLLSLPQANNDHAGMVTIGLPLVMKCLGQHMVYDSTKHRVRLKAHSEVRLRGAELGLPAGYLAWLCADDGARATNILRIRVSELKAGEEILGRTWKGVDG
ncbi:hypothetical protein P153DRAFT_353295 [Dothidotthia symphoricarpi CBS 119687]|uniref:Uncharacterized protein n=1 Tax=Dothidotthia symphoricarpi CBS 119687 TaxID=1392245 RepID=A0A6A6AQ16_9PLEO|nr:uncharacterized protein P153DRAFT_353295 [Dothidotthia symphoricarpi CBS 119687]KAF2134092.1 hypothetical protein P153DRAFT_353295 [Dothidotthia symphoricarpi CBS 119687]